MALRAAWPAEGFHIESFGNGQHEVIPDNASRTKEELDGAVAAWGANGAVTHAREAAIQRIKGIANAKTFLFWPDELPPDDAAMTAAFGAYLRAIFTNAHRLIAEIEASSDPDQINLASGWPS